MRRVHTVNVAVRQWKFMERWGSASARLVRRLRLVAEGLRRNSESKAGNHALDPRSGVLTLYTPFPRTGVSFPQQCTTRIATSSETGRTGTRRKWGGCARNSRKCSETTDSMQNATSRGTHIESMGTRVCRRSTQAYFTERDGPNRLPGCSEKTIQPNQKSRIRTQWSADVGNGCRRRLERAGTTKY